MERDRRVAMVTSMNEQLRSIGSLYRTNDGIIFTAVSSTGIYVRNLETIDKAKEWIASIK